MPPRPRRIGGDNGRRAARGLVLWVVAAQIVMPLWLGMPERVFALGATPLRSLAGHLVYGAITGVVMQRLDPSTGRARVRGRARAA